MTAIVEIASQQFAVQPNQILTVPLTAGNPGDIVEYANIVMAMGDGTTSVGKPYVAGSVKAKILAHGKGDTILVFKKKRRKGYQKLNGHRQNFTQIQIEEINLN